MSASVGAVPVAKPEHLLEDLVHRRQRVEPPALHLVEQAPQLRVAGDRLLEMALRARRRDGEYLAREVPPPPLLEAPLRPEIGAVLLDPLPQLGHVLAAKRFRQHDRRAPVSLAIERED